ncbi:MAG: Zn-dependent hydrolase, glyoxylase, partial [Acidobacteria bacterium]|nr:Zn-dependent hydrolase, glyoxylase [Acidobacteriota bacterium]
MKIIPLSIPTPFYVGDVNVYLVKEDPLTLIDVGPKTPEAAAALREKLKRNGVRIGDIRRIVLTHAHEDHCGLAKQIRDEAGNAEILVHRWETGHLFGRMSREEHRNLIARAGVPDAVFQEIQSAYQDISLLTDVLAENEFSALRDESE